MLSNLLKILKFSIVFVSIALFSVQSAAQLPVPNLCAVSVDSVLNKPVLYWKIDNPSEIDGIIIKRIIWGGSGVVDGTLNNVAVLNDPYANSFIDTTTTYNTQALPLQRSETYIITSYKNINGVPQYSNFSQKQSTIFLKAEYDQCCQIVYLHWTKTYPFDTAQVWLKFNSSDSMLAETTDTQYIFRPLTDGLYKFYIKTKTSNCITDKILSNIAQLQISSVQRPKLLYIQSINACFLDKIQIYFINLNDSYNQPIVKLYRDGKPIYSTNYNCDCYVYDTVNPNNAHQYKLIAYSVCDSPIAESNIAYNMLLFAKYNQQKKQIQLNWTQYNYWYGRTERFDIFYGTDTSNFIRFASTTDTFYVLSLEDLITTGDLPSKLYFSIFAIETDNPFGKNKGSWSNIAIVEPEAEIFVPNAINPLSPNPADREFKIYAEFISDFQLTILDRNGQIIFQTTDIYETWKGTYPNGQLVPVDTYLYIIRYKAGNKTYFKKGAVSVVY